MPRRQCAKCPWKKSTDPHTIPDGYDVAKHRKLKKTIAEPGDMRGSAAMMACHEFPVGKEQPCVGWLIHQLGPGNNLGLRLQVITGAVDADVEVVGEQHETFEDTLPKGRKRRTR